MQKQIFGFLLLSSMFCLPAETNDNLLLNSGFEEKGKNWISAAVFPGKGRNGTAAARYVRTDEKARVVSVRQQIRLEPDTSYEFGGFVKTEGPVKPGKRGGFIFILTWFKPENGQYVGSHGFYIEPEVKDWELFSKVFTTPKQKYDYRFMFYFEQGATGTIWVDDVFVHKMANEKMADLSDPSNLVRNPHFDYGTRGYTGGAKVDRKAGRGGSHALAFSRVDKDKSFYAVRQVHFLEPNTKYIFGGYAKGVGKLNDTLKKSIMITIEPRRAKDRQFHGIVKAMPVEVDKATGYTRFEKILKTFPGLKSTFGYEITVYLPKGVCGTVYVDDLYLRKLEPEKTQPNGIITMVYPAFLRLPAEGVTADFTMSHPAKDGSVFRWSLLNSAGKTVASGAAKNRGNKFQIKFGKTAPGDYTLKFTPPSGWGTSAPLPVTVAAKQKWSGTVCSLDEKGRAIVNGKPFMPLGFLIYRISKKDIGILAKSPFNTLMSYSSDELDLSGNKPPKGTDLFKGIIETMDELDRNNLKLIFSVKDFYNFQTVGENLPGIQQWNGIKGVDNIVKTIVARLKNHPALLAWYICDEIQQQEADDVIARRRLLNRLDPQHPTWAVHLKGQNFNFHIDWQDVFGCDPYPIQLVNSDNMKIVTDYMKGAVEAFGTPRGLACWAVPQAYHVGIYSARGANAKNFRKYRYPTEHEMLASTIQMAIHGVKGFLFFNYSDFFRGPDKDQFEKRWPEMLRVGEKLKSLEPFILSERAPENLKLESVTGKVFSKVLRDSSGRPCILLAAEGPGKASAEFTFPGDLNSECGKTVSLGNGRYRFTAENIACDIIR